MTLIGNPTMGSSPDELRAFAARARWDAQLTRDQQYRQSLLKLAARAEAAAKETTK